MKKLYYCYGEYGVGEEARIQLNLGNKNRMSVSRFMY